MSGIAERLAEVLVAHEPGNERIHYGSAKRLADSLAELVEREIAEARGEALREAADELDTTDHATETALQGVDHVIWWLRNRAALSPDPDCGEGEGK